MKEKRIYLPCFTCFESCQASDIKIVPLFKNIKICIRCIHPRTAWTPRSGVLVDMVWNNVIVFWTFIFEWKSFICFKLVIWMDCPQYICITNRHILTMGAFLLLFLCSVQGFSSAVQTYSELIYPVPRHKVRNLENPEPQLSPESFQCSKVSISSGLCMCLSYFLGYQVISIKVNVIFQLLRTFYFPFSIVVVNLLRMHFGIIIINTPVLILE